jgi:hypothetical protein
MDNAMNFQFPSEVLEEVKGLLWPGKLDRLVKHPDYNFMYARMQHISDLSQDVYYTYKALYEFNVIYLTYQHLENNRLKILINTSNVICFNHSDIFCQFMIDASLLLMKYDITKFDIQTEIR